MQRHHHEIGVFIFLLLFFASSDSFTEVSAGNGPSHGAVLFVKETIAVTILADDTLQVRGIYWFAVADSSATEIMLYYPFPVDTSSGYPFFIDIKDTSSPGVIPFEMQEQGVTFSITVKPGDTTSVVVLYRQKVRGRKGRYILTTTANWGKPLVDSRYSVSVPSTLTLAYMSYECDSIARAGKFLVYSFSKKQFMPDRDLCFRWQANDTIEKNAR